jgi:hypothetical protein
LSNISTCPPQSSFCFNMLMMFIMLLKWQTLITLDLAKLEMRSIIQRKK